MSDGSKTLIVGMALLFGVIITCTYISHRTDLAYIEAGYTRTTLPGASSPRWVLPPETGVDR